MTEDTLAGRITQLSPEARARLKQRLASRRPAGGPLIPRRDPAEPVPLSFAQARLWFLEQLRPGTNAWNTPVAVVLRGPLDLDALRGSLQLLVDRHETLRTVICAPGGRPVPVLLDAPSIELPVVDASGVAEEELDDTVRRFVDTEVAGAFNLESDLMLRARLLRIAPEHHVLVLVAHHIACDGWSKGLLIEELGIAYEALSANRPPELPELPIEYADFIVWQRTELSDERLRSLAEHWKQRLAGAPAALELPADHPRPARQAFRGAVQWLAVREPVAGSTRALGRSERATPFMTVLAAFTAFLYAQSGQEDLLVGSPSAMRTHPELERIVGLFANTLVYRTGLHGRPSFREAIRRIRDTAIDVYAHQDLPFEKIVEAVRPPRDVSRNPLVQVNLRLEPREPELRLAGLESLPISIDPGIARFDLAIELGQTDDGWTGYLEYDAALFDPQRAAAYAGDFVAVLSDCVQSPDAPLDDLPSIRAIASRAGR